MKKQKDNLIVYVSSRNNYDMLEREVFRNIDLEGFEFINVDDHSSQQEVSKGKEICKKNNIVFLENSGRGVQHATQTLVEFINKNRPNCEWIICFQHDCYPITKEFFSRISGLIDSGKLKEFGTLGFNRIDHGKHTPHALDKWKNGLMPMGMLGLSHLSVKNPKRWTMPGHIKTIETDERWKEPFSVEITAWTAIGINVKKWNKHITPTSDHHFHLWAPDVSMHFLKNNCHNLVLPKLYIFNHQELKAKYSINPNSARGAKSGNNYHFGNYSNFSAWEKTWGWDYEKPWESIDDIRKNHDNTLIRSFVDHDISLGPLLNFQLGEY